MAQPQPSSEPTAKSGSERRVIERIASNVDAVWYDGKDKVSCRLLDVSPTGARLKVSDADAMPDVFRMYVPEFQMLYEVERRWRKGDAVSVMFLRSWRKAPR